MNRSTIRLFLVGATVFALASASAVYWQQHKPRLARRPVRIGVDQAAPYQSWVPGKGATGFSVELLTEAARRRDIDLQWVYRPEGPGPAFLARNVDMWPLISAPWIQSRGLHATAPFFENQYAIAWLSDDASSPHTTREWKGKAVATANLPVSIRMANTALPGILLRPSKDRVAALQQVCAGTAEGAFMELRLLEFMLIRRPPNCGDKNFHVQFFHDLHVPMGLASMPAFNPEADALREEIDAMFQDGKYAEITDHWFLFSSIEGHSAIEKVVERRFRVLTMSLISVMAVMIVLLVVLYRRSRRDKHAAELASCAKSQFLASVSHEVRTPMNGVLGMADLLLATPLAPDQKEYANSILESAQLQLSILNDILDSSKIESGMLALDNKPFSPQEIIADVINLYGGMAREQGLALQAATSSLPKLVMGDGRRVNQILGNLVSNAIKFTSAGSVIVDARLAPTVEASASAGNAPRHPAARLRFSVTDTGIGIPEHAQATIFDRFTQVQSGPTRRYGGTGLGLNISKRLVEQMGGFIRMESRQGAGSCFWFEIELPVVPEIPPSHDPGEVAVSSFEPYLTVLVAEDNRVNQRVVCAQLDKLGLRSVVANNGLEAVAKASRANYAAILMDCHMPEMDGWEATRKIRASGGGSRTPIIAMTASVTEADRKEAIDSGMDDFLSKPFTAADLTAVLSRWLPLASPRSQMTAH